MANPFRVRTTLCDGPRVLASSNPGLKLANAFGVFLCLLDNLAKSEFNENLRDRESIWDVVEEINTELPADTWETVPTDGAINLDHYLYGAPKRQQ